MSCELLLSMIPRSLPISERAGSMVSTESATSDIIIAVREMNSANPNSGISPFVMKHLWGCFRKLITEYVKRFHNITRDSYLLDFQ